MRLYLIPVAEIAATGGPVPVYLIRTDEGANVLVDTGYARDRAGLPGPVKAEPGADVVSRLAGLGVRPDDVHYVVCSHFDPDHAGNHDAFPSAEFVVQRRHDELARSRAVPRLEMCRASWDHPGLKYSLVDGDTELVPGVELVESSGHVEGHQSVLVRLPETGPVLLAVDAVPEQAAADPATRRIYPFDLDEQATRASTARLARLARDEKALVVYGHDARQWRDLRTWPGYLS
ncbi:N-acyl homoserine lactonase family protein [Sphaerisporangium sp. TRM90804]|uniref:N-acyl homoserine lactonase family protein n=1 Tax=Sphaerisporangium sp. TRM90804 TaxID=3031113 RepID=UPI00244C9EF8|nr:N-acyl homoserine lactonase family protein [Sphaerisporangium sp. TRM90804]MDH2427225.1 N-acyl homoserine lactonase family protein [Sphaerisporangium sp. TRM90804]